MARGRRWAVLLAAVGACLASSACGTDSVAISGGQSDGGAGQDVSTFPGPDASSHLDSSPGSDAPALDAPALDAPGADAPDGSTACDPNKQDLVGCPCGAQGTTRACYTGDPATRNVGICRDGVQTCQASGEGTAWGACLGSITPAPENCSGTVDDNCDGKVGCADPTCATTPACATACTTGQTRPCYDGPPGTLGIGICHAGTQTCTGGQWGATCAGEVTPSPETCTNNVDSNCDGTAGCSDPTCATNPACMAVCTNGMTRSCYDGPSGTNGVGLCHSGTQTCTNGQWPSNCPGEVTPQPENCCDALDHNCNGLAGCNDIFSCLTAACCLSSCNAATLDPGCVCPQGSGDTATCPDGDHQVAQSMNSSMLECCPCTVNDCTDLNCCGDAVCAGSASCVGLTCNPLPPSCNGQVSTDCDDFPEDCDEACCKCTMGCP